MEAISIHPPTDQSFSPYKSHIRNYKKIKPQFISTSSDCSLKPYLLPLPISNSCENSTVYRKGGLGDHAWATVYQKQRDDNRKTKYNGTRDQNPSHTFKKSKQSTNSPSDRKDLPKNVANFVTNNIISTCDSFCSLEAVEKQDDKFSGSVVSILSPPPSSLPLPTFSLRSKHSCSAEAAGIDIGATNNLRRLLRL